MKTRQIILAFLILAFVTDVSKARQVRVSSVPDWVKPNAYLSELENDEDTYSGVKYLLVDIQDKIIATETYLRFAIGVLNSEGLEAFSDIEVEFDPTFQELVFHKAVIIRDGVEINKLNESEIQVFRKEENSNRYLYDGSLNAVINLTDVRVGDIIEYAYSTIGENPIHDGRYFAKLKTEYQIPFSELRYRIINDDKRDLNFKYFNGAQRPIVTETSDAIEYNWVIKDRGESFYEDYTPSWYDPFRSIQVTEFSEWKEVVQWALPHYTPSTAEQNKIKAESSTLFEKNNLDQMIQTAIRFTQDDVRYLGFESGMSAYKPNAPTKVLNRRFGDCKDKSVLLASMLVAMGVEAHPMLVNSTVTESLEDYLPSPKVFDHCVVTYVYKGERFFVDPTINNQGGTIDDLSFPDYGYGLVLKEGETELIELPADEASKIDVEEVFRLGQVGKGAVYTISTKYYGAQADGQRAMFESNTLSSISENYENYYGGIYRGLEATKKLSIEDEREDENVFETKEEYVIPSIWDEYPGSNSTLVADFAPYDMTRFMITNLSSNRDMPVYIGEPVEYNSTIAIEFPQDWSISPSSESITGPGISFESEVIPVNTKKVLLTYNYTILKPTIEPSEVEDFIEAQERIDESLIFQVSYNESVQGFSASWIMIGITLLALVLSIIVCFNLYQKYDPKPTEQENPIESIGGWLFLIALGLTVAPIRILFGLIQEANFYNANVINSLLSSSELSYNPELAFLIMTELFFNICIIIFPVFLIILLAKRRSSFPKLYIFYIGGHFVFLLVDALLTTLLASDVFTSEELSGYYGDVFRSFLGICIWIPYMLISTRVKRTFVTRFAKDDSEPDHAPLESDTTTFSLN
ncbi:MAG: DUF3857 domain-containing protein [Bacteroidota bacterium]